MLVKLDHFPRDRDENKKCLKPPPSQQFIFGNSKQIIPGGETGVPGSIRSRQVSWGSLSVFSLVFSDFLPPFGRDFSIGSIGLVPNIGYIVLGVVEGNFCCFLPW